jgi:hypothetical protein
MKRTILPLLLASALLGQVANAQITSTTPVIGYYKFDVPVGNTAWVCGFVTKKDFQGAATSMTAGANSVINQTGATFGAFPLHYVEILSGPKAGLILDIVSNTATTITVEGNTTTLGLTGTETYCVRRHATLGTVFQGGAGLTTGADNVSIFDSLGGSITYAYNGLNWEDALTGDPGDDAIIYPGQGFVITNGTAATETVTFGGNDVSYVKTGPTMVPVYTVSTNLIGLVNPLVGTAPTDVSTLGAMNLVASLTPGGDQVGTLSLDGLLALTGVYTNNGINMEDALTGDDASNVAVRNGAAFSVTPSSDKLINLPQLHP